MLPLAVVAATVAALLAGCRRPAPTSTYYADQARNAAPGIPPWFCNAAGNGTPLGGHGNGSHVNPLYEGKVKGPLSSQDCAKLTRQLDETWAAVKAYNCLLADGVAPDSDPCWDFAHRDPSLGMPAGAGGTDHDGSHDH
jgi:hypothetical protein